MLKESRASPRGLVKPAKGAAWKHEYDSEERQEQVIKGDL
jgi:hypothetical protein